MQNSQLWNLTFKLEIFILQITVPGAARSWEEQLRGLTARRQNKVYKKQLNSMSV